MSEVTDQQMAAAALVDLYRECEIPAVRIRPETWGACLADLDLAPGILGVLTDESVTTPSLDMRFPKDRLVSRRAIQRVADETDPANPDNLLRSFLLIQAWGAGTSGNRALRYTRDALADRERLLASLKLTTQTLRGADGMDSLAEAFMQWRCSGVRRSLRYQAYVEVLHSWASSAGVEADRLEWVLFRHNGGTLPDVSTAV
ncbi:8-oxoguanine DNA glycosylase OGG fold protein [Salana multivorans]